MNNMMPMNNMGMMYNVFANPNAYAKSKYAK